MISRGVFALLMTVLVSCGGPEPVGEKDRVALRYLKEVQWSAAYRGQDTVLLDRILHEDFQLIDAEGNVFSKADELD